MGKYSKETVRQVKELLKDDDLVRKLNQLFLDVYTPGLKMGERKVNNTNYEEEDGNLVYLIRCNEFVKIGTTGNLKRRLNGLRGSNPYPLEVIYSKRKENARAVEQKLHKLFKEKRERLEWFKLTEEDILKIKEILCQKNLKT